MDADRNYLTIEPSETADASELQAALYDGDVFDEWTSRPNGNITVVGVGASHEPAKDRLFEYAESVDRAFLLHVHDTVASGHSYLYEQQDGELTMVESVGGAEGRFGRDLVDYAKREYDFDTTR